MKLQVLVVANRLWATLAANFLSKLAVENLTQLTSTFFAWEHKFAVQSEENDICFFY